jgi:hypothetical protein
MTCEDEVHILWQCPAITRHTLDFWFHTVRTERYHEVLVMMVSDDGFQTFLSVAQTWRSHSPCNPNGT